MSTLPQAVARQVDAAGLSGARLVAAVSGGPDSLALLHALHCIAGSHTLSLHVAHVDHGLRPSSGQDAEFVRERAGALSLPCTIVAVDVPSRRDGSFSESAARDARYWALSRVAEVEGAAAIATGHTLDDQAETVLLHAVRGSGLAGLRAMSVLSAAPVGGSPSRIFRPLLGVRRSETLAYCRELGLAPLEDESNSDARIPRNLVRLDVMPLLERLNPRAADALARLAATAGNAQDFLDVALDAEWPSLAVAREGAVALDRERLRALHPALRALAVRRACAEVGGSATLDAAHVEAVLQLVEGPAGREAPLPGGVRAEARHDTLVLHAPGASLLPSLDGEHALRVPGVTAAGGWRVEIQFVPMLSNLDSPLFTALLDADALGDELSMRARRPGDRFQPLGMAEGSRKLQDCLVDAHVPRRERDAVPLLVSPRGVAWVVGHAVAHWARVMPETRRVLRIDASREGTAS
ncbi:MAG: tRNA lysidine(34) synthetase TilS [Chloroflexota bacterium]|nr:tRNA lysidine(34) synthetase TilS [Chloroflexota bacterium]MDE2968477.1 tRNA lysidine(34) synthetase TilS [Chloroflexota bacterium]